MEHPNLSRSLLDYVGKSIKQFFFETPSGLCAMKRSQAKRTEWGRNNAWMDRWWMDVGGGGGFFNSERVPGEQIWSVVDLMI